jgi:signal transduction histidine kinase
MGVPAMSVSDETVLNVLLVDDSPDDAELVAAELRRGRRRVSVERVSDAMSMRAALARQTWDLVLSDWTIPAFKGDAALEVLKAAGHDSPLIIVSGTVTEELALQAMRAGARDWLLKNKLAGLLPAVERELEAAAERKRAKEALRRSDERLRQSQKMDAIGGLAAGVAHDFNNVLSVIIGYADLLLLEPASDGSWRENVEEIRNAAARAAELTHQLLAFSRQQVLQPRPTHLSSVVAGMAKMLRRLIGEDVELAIEGMSHNGIVLVDPGQMAQVILNLAVNARDAMPKGGRLLIGTTDVHVDADLAAEHPGLTTGPHVMLVVSDTGVGMDAATQARIFEPFFTTKEPGRGTGLGLATVCGIVEQSGGTIVTTSAPGQGTTFRIYLPQTGAAPSSASPDDPKPCRRRSRPGDETVLLVEDDDAVRSMLATVLRSNQYRVVEASNGLEALRLVDNSSDRIDLVLTDVVMPRMNGREFAVEVERLRPGTRVLYMSGYTDGTFVHHGVLESGSAFLQKPIVPAVLIDTVRDMLSAATSNPVAHEDLHKDSHGHGRRGAFRQSSSRR